MTFCANLILYIYIFDDCGSETEPGISSKVNFILKFAEDINLCVLCRVVCGDWKFTSIQNICTPIDRLITST